ncbi:PHP domain-containing protein, partial [Staphylococcus pseudintermedius]|nr:PHP domain-containing protein [Staphylococcus pseudintermedius]
MTERNEYVLHHNHSYYSNLRLTDAITSPRQLIETAKQYGYKGMSITEHESLSSAVDMIKTVKEMKASGELREDFRMLLGNEIYLVDSLEEVRDNYESGKTKFPHFCLIAKNRKGFEALSKLSTQAWKNSFFSSSIMERVPTEKAYLREVAQSDEYKGTLMASSACFIEGTKVKTKDGLKSIERIGKGEKVLTHKNRWKKVVTPTTRLYKGNFVELDTSHGGRKVTATENHKFLVLGDKIKDSINEDRFKDIHKNISGLTHSKKYLLKQLCYEYET